MAWLDEDISIIINLHWLIGRCFIHITVAPLCVWPTNQQGAERQLWPVTKKSTTPGVYAVSQAFPNSCEISTELVLTPVSYNHQVFLSWTTQVPVEGGNDGSLAYTWTIL